MTGLLLLLLVAGSMPADIHVDARDHPRPGEGEAAFAAMERALVRGFDDICGDTFCEGDYGNLRALQLRCAVTRNTGAVAECLWSFAGSYAWVNERDALPSVDSRTWACRLPVVPGTRLSVLLPLLSGPGALDTALPCSDPITCPSTYDALTDCL
ncbi:hypothetical protein [Stenotrophomonas tumulicola]|uniref:Uncharacterized protein n=1 Tax=Stenotrophomonas tumulicola TaxID=1685415 RepID=A0A7W3IHB3_9GAMM|nr:hypothetical protein [Stenotrophomonas tumulicola]MBA8681697.1 hypothetical protein [Stenotrophomonas tumulicola]